MFRQSLELDYTPGDPWIALEGPEIVVALKQILDMTFR